MYQTARVHWREPVLSVNVEVRNNVCPFDYMVLFEYFFVGNEKQLIFSGAVLKNLLKSMDICGNSYFRKNQTSLEGV